MAAPEAPSDVGPITTIVDVADIVDVAIGKEEIVAVIALLDPEAPYLLPATTDIVYVPPGNWMIHD